MDEDVIKSQRAYIDKLINSILDTQDKIDYVISLTSDEDIIDELVNIHDNLKDTIDEC